jgi:hypothetical protein
LSALGRATSRRLACVPAAMLLACVAPEAAVAQLVPGLPIAVEVRTGAALPVGELGRESPGLGAGTGIVAAAALHVPLASPLAFYASYAYGRYGCGACGAAGLDGGLPEAGFEIGLEVIDPLGMGRLDPWLAAGVLLGRRLEIPDGADGFSSDAAVGWSVGAGVQVPVAPALRLIPGIRYRSYSARFVFPDLGFGFVEDGTLEHELDVASLALEIGLSYEL